MRFACNSVDGARDCAGEAAAETNPALVPFPLELFELEDEEERGRGPEDEEEAE